MWTKARKNQQRKPKAQYAFGPAGTLIDRYSSQGKVNGE